jgi:leucyl aminopeptidase
MIELRSIDTKNASISTLAIPVCEDAEIHNDPVALLAAKAKQFEEFSGKQDETLILYNLPGTKAKRVIFLGIGTREKIDAEKLRSFAGKAVKSGISKNLADMVLAVPLNEKLPVNSTAAVEAMLEGACLANHVFDVYKKEKKLKQLKNIILSVDLNTEKTLEALLHRVLAVCEGALLARDWVTTPSNDKKPDQFSRAILASAKKAKLKTAVLDEKALKEGKFGAILAVGAGSQNKPRLVLLEYAPQGAKRTIALVGKGVTFDSGGINLKPSGSLEDMKTDMSGAAAVAATLLSLSRLKPKIRVIGVIPIVENMPSGTATRPGDIIKSHDGKTVEIGNTDAEGRLILIDAMSYVQKKYQPEIMIDIATLTGACVVALGEKIAGLFTQDEELADMVMQSSRRTGERLWRMPLPDDYKELLKSDTADISNMSSSRWGGAITAALFLSEFAKDTRWAHIDIAGPASIKKGHDYCDAGGTGFGVRLFCDLVQRLV